MPSFLRQTSICEGHTTFPGSTSLETRIGDFSLLDPRAESKLCELPIA